MEREEQTASTISNKRTQKENKKEKKKKKKTIRLGTWNVGTLL
jgi:hypothetical protein